MRRACRSLLLLPVLLACACTEPRTPPKPAAPQPAGGETVRVVFSLPGDDIGSPERAAALERIKAAISERGAGEILGSGFGMGSMELIVRLRGEGSRAALEALVREDNPAARFRIEQARP